MVRPHSLLRLAGTAALAFAVACGGGGGSAEGDGDEGGSDGWRSALYPAEGWTPATTDAEGRYLPDVSYAGYRNGEADLPDLSGRPVVDVVADHGADPTGQTDATAAFQAAIDAASAGTVVYVPAGLYRVDDLLTVTRSGVVIRGAGAAESRLYFTRHANLTGRAHLTFSGARTTGADLPLAADGQARSKTVALTDASALQVGDDVLLGQTISDAFVADHGMTGTWQAFNGTWQGFFRRAVVAVETVSSPHVVTLDVPLRYPLLVRDGASLRVETGYLEEVGITDVGLANAVGWEEAWANERAHVLAFDGVKDAWARRVASFAPPASPASGPGAGDHLQNGGIFVRYAKRVTIADCRMERAENRGGGGCGYLFEILQTNEVLTRDCVARSGRHNFIQNWGFGTTGCVWLRCTSTDGFAVVSRHFPGVGSVGHSEYHHSLATANLVDGCSVGDGWSAIDRGSWSSGAGVTATQCVFWNTTGSGVLRSRQFGWGYVIGTGPDLSVQTSLSGASASGSAPEDWTEGLGDAPTLRPPSLYEDQLRRRTGR